MRVLFPAALIPLLLLGACGKAPPPPAPPAPPAQTAAAPTTAAAPAAATGAPAATSSIAPAATTAAAAAEAAGPETAGDVVLAQGSVTDTGADGKTRQLQDGDTVYPGDSFVLGDDSYLDVDLADGGRILLRPNTSFQIQEYHFDPAAHPAAAGEPAPEPLFTPPQPENAFFKLVKGGLRAVDGLIGQSHPENYGVETPVATIGVRGTAFDVRYCGDDCKDETDASGAPENGLYTSVSEGSIGVKNDTGETVTPAGHSTFVKSRRERVVALAAPPKALRHMQLPDKFKARDDSMRSKVHVRQLERRRQIIERRRQQAPEHKPPQAGERGKGGAETPAERRQERLEKRGELTPAERRQERLERREGKQSQTETGTGRKGEAKTPEERRQERREERQAGQGRREEAPQAKEKPESAATGKTPAAERQEKRKEKEAAKQNPPAAAAPKTEQGKTAQGSKEQCKDKKKKQDKDKDKDKCND